MGYCIILQLNGGSFLEFQLLCETAAPRTIEFFRVSHQSNTSNFQPFHFTSSHLHMGTELWCFLLPRPSSDWLPFPPDGDDLHPTIAPWFPLNSWTAQSRSSWYVLYFFFFFGRGEKWDLATLPRSKHLISRLRQLHGTGCKQVGFAHFYYFWRFFAGKQTRLELPRAAPPNHPWNRWCNASYLASFNSL